MKVAVCAKQSRCLVRMLDWKCLEGIGTVCHGIVRSVFFIDGVGVTCPLRIALYCRDCDTLWNLPLFRLGFLYQSSCDSYRFLKLRVKESRSFGRPSVTIVNDSMPAINTHKLNSGFGKKGTSTVIWLLNWNKKYFCECIKFVVYPIWLSGSDVIRLIKVTPACYVTKSFLPLHFHYMYCKLGTYIDKLQDIYIMLLKERKIYRKTVSTSLQRITDITKFHTVPLVVGIYVYILQCTELNYVLKISGHT